jgi:hypothetical protein
MDLTTFVDIVTDGIVSMMYSKNDVVSLPYNHVLELGLQHELI